MGLAVSMAKWLSRSLTLSLVLAALPAWAQVSTSDRAEIVRLAQSRGIAEIAVTPIVQEVDRAAAQGIPQAPLLNKVKEGLSKGYPAARVQGVVSELISQMETARDMLGAVPDDAMRVRAIVVLAEAVGRGVTQPEFQELRRLAEQPTSPAADRLALGAKTWALFKEAGFTTTSALPLVAEAVRQGFRDAEMMALAREATRRRQDLSPAGLERARDAVRRGERPERVFPPRDATQTPERPRTERPATPERPATVERPAPSDVPQRPGR
jgi:hypothetical protein